MRSRADRAVAKHLGTLNPLPPLGTKVTFDGVEGRVRGYVTGRHPEDARSVMVELKRGFFANTDNHTPRDFSYVTNIFLSSVLVHASNLLDADGRRAWALPDEVGHV